MKFFTTAAEVQGVLKQSAVKALLEVTQPLEVALEFLRREAPTRYLVPSIEHIVMSQVTTAALFEVLWDLDRAKAPIVARAIGENAGVRFADSLWDWFVSIEQIPGDDTSLLDLWMQIDSSANWGTFEFSKSEGQLVVHVANSFLIRSQNPPFHDYCSFLEGYVFGFMWTSLKELHHWLKGAGKSPPDARISPPGTIRQCAGRRCSIEIHTMPDELSDAFEQLMIARHMTRTQAHLIDAQVVPLRRCLEAAFKIKLGFKSSDRWEHVIRAARSVLTYAPFPPLIKGAVSVYAALSGQVHDSPESLLNSDRVRALARETADILRGLEYASVGKDKKQLLQEQAVKAQSRKTSNGGDRST